MKVKMKESFTGVVAGKIYRMEEGQEIELPDGARWVEAGLARPLKAQPETATKAQPAKRKKVN